MKLYLIIGFVILLITSLMSLFLGNIEFLVYTSAIIGFCFLMVGLMFTGVLLPSDRIRETNRWESPDETKRRFRMFLLCLGIGLPNLIASMVIFFLFLDK